VKEWHYGWLVKTIILGRAGKSMLKTLKSWVKL